MKLWPQARTGIWSWRTAALNETSISRTILGQLQFEIKMFFEQTFSTFFSYEAAMRYLRKQADLNPDIVTLTKEGTTEEGRDLMLIKISDKSGTDTAEKKAVWIDSGLTDELFTEVEWYDSNISNLNCHFRNPCKRMDRPRSRLLRGRQAHRGLLLPRDLRRRVRRRLAHYASTQSRRVRV